MRTYTPLVFCLLVILYLSFDPKGVSASEEEIDEYNEDEYVYDEIEEEEEELVRKRRYTGSAGRPSGGANFGVPSQPVSGFPQPSNVNPSFVRPGNLNPGFHQPTNVNLGFSQPPGVNPGFPQPPGVNPGFPPSPGVNPGLTRPFPKPPGHTNAIPTGGSRPFTGGLFNRNTCTGVPRGSPHWVPGLDTYCPENCPRGHCPKHLCVCY